MFLALRQSRSRSVRAARSSASLGHKRKSQLDSEETGSNPGLFLLGNCSSDLKFEPFARCAALVLRRHFESDMTHLELRLKGGDRSMVPLVLSVCEFGVTWL